MESESDPASHTCVGDCTRLVVPVPSIVPTSARRSRGRGGSQVHALTGHFLPSLYLEGRSRELPGPVWNTRPAMSCSLSLLTCSPLARETCDTRIQIWRSSLPDEERAITKINPEPCSFLLLILFFRSCACVCASARLGGMSSSCDRVPSPRAESRCRRALHPGVLGWRTMFQSQPLPACKSRKGKQRPPTFSQGLRVGPAAPPTRLAAPESQRSKTHQHCKLWLSQSSLGMALQVEKEK